jgi:hypothetical protein
MSDEILNLIIAMTMAAIPAGWGALVSSRWWAQSVPWIGRKLAAIIAYAVARVFREYVDELLAEKARNNLDLDLTQEEAGMALKSAETIIEQKAAVAGIEKALPEREVLLGMIQQEVVKQKAVKRPRVIGAGKGFR